MEVEAGRQSRVMPAADRVNYTELSFGRYVLLSRVQDVLVVNPDCIEGVTNPEAMNTPQFISRERKLPWLAILEVFRKLRKTIRLRSIAPIYPVSATPFLPA